MAFGSETVFKQITLFDHFGTIAMSGEGKLASLIWRFLNAQMYHTTFFSQIPQVQTTKCICCSSIKVERSFQLQGGWMKQAVILWKVKVKAFGVCNMYLSWDDLGKIMSEWMIYYTGCCCCCCGCCCCCCCCCRYIYVITSPYRFGSHDLLFTNDMIFDILAGLIQLDILG